MVLAQIDVQSLEEAPEFDREAFENLTVMNGTGDEAQGAGLADREAEEQETAQQQTDEEGTAGQDAEREDMMAESRPAHDAGQGAMAPGPRDVHRPGLPARGLRPRRG